jgi:Protein of unknown function (DUF664)
MTQRKHPDMWVDPEDDPREAIASAGGEKGVLTEYLDRYRVTLQMKCGGLDAEQMARRSVPPSTLSLLGFVRHLAKVEHSWFRRVLLERSDLPQLYWSEEDRDLAFSGALPDADVCRRRLAVVVPGGRARSGVPRAPAMSATLTCCESALMVELASKRSDLRRLDEDATGGSAAPTVG